jgi:hypothetical protein
MNWRDPEDELSEAEVADFGGSIEAINATTPAEILSYCSNLSNCRSEMLTVLDYINR